MLCNRRFIAYDLPTNYTMDPSILLGIGLGGVFPLALMLPLYETKLQKMQVHGLL